MANTFGCYKLSRQLNRGATAVVFEAEETNIPMAWQSSSPLVALKVFNERAGGGFTIPVSTIQQEIKCASCMQHPNIAQLLNVVPHGDRLGLAFELVQGPDLLDYIMRYKNCVPEELAIHYFRQMVCAVQHIHEQNIVHRDLKPENCMIDIAAHTLKVIDFGLASPANAQCRTGCGTINTIAPECIALDGLSSQVRNPEAVDLWGLGVTLYIMLSGTYPFQHPQQPWRDDLQRRNILRGHMHPLPRRVSPATRDLIRKILQVDPQRRPTLQRILAHPALQQNAPSDSLFEQESELFAEMHGMGSRVSSYASQPSDVSPERARPSYFPPLIREDSIDMENASSESQSPPPERSTDSSPTKDTQAVSASDLLCTTTGRMNLFSSHGYSSSWNSFGSLNATLASASPLSGSLPNLGISSPVPSLRISPAREAFSTVTTSMSTSRSNASLSSQLELIQAALAEDSAEESQAAKTRRLEDVDFDEHDTEFGSEFDMGDKVRIGRTSGLTISLSQSSSIEASPRDPEHLSHRSVDSSCSLPWSPKDAAERPVPIRLFSVSTTDLTTEPPASSPFEPPNTGAPRVASVQHLSPFKSLLSNIPEETDECMDEDAEDESNSKDLGIVSLSLLSDVTTYEMS